jgi:hypothetical protein
MVRMANWHIGGCWFTLAPFPMTFNPISVPLVKTKPQKWSLEAYT